jgi:hypothetical protein
VIGDAALCEMMLSGERAHNLPLVTPSAPGDDEPKVLEIERQNKATFVSPASSAQRLNSTARRCS